MPLKLVLFDLDGTLLDTLDDLADATNAALGCFGLPPLPASDYKLLVGNGVRVLMRRAVAAALARMADPAPGPFADEALIDAFNREYEARWACRTRPYDGIPQLLDTLRASGLKLGILSNKPNAFTCRIAERFFPDQPFDLVTGMRPEYPAKPDPGLAMALCREVGIAPEDAVLVGDSDTDMLTARAAGLEPIGVLWGFRTAEELAGAGARHLVEAPEALAELLLGYL